MVKATTYAAAVLACAACVKPSEARTPTADTVAAAAEGVAVGVASSGDASFVQTRVDTRRGVLAIPLSTLGRVQLWRLGPSLGATR